MIRALIVDDEKITRKGMISVIPWGRFGIEIVGDVGSGAGALEFMVEHPVDLAFVDVAMPGMSGIELIRELRSRGFACAVVVLTFYDDFEYVQEALRLGAVDYVLKTQLDDERIVQMLERVTQRIREATARQAAEPWDLFCLVAPGQGLPAVRRALAGLAPAVKDAAVTGSRAALLRLPDGPAVSAAARVAEEAGAVLVKLAGARGAEPRELLGRLEARVERHVFYERPLGGEPCLLDAGALGEEPGECPPAELAALSKAWSSTSWILRDAAFGELVDRTRALAPGAAEASRMLDAARADLVRTFVFLAGEPQPPASRACVSWGEWQEAFQAIRRAVRGRLAAHHYSEEVARKTIEALEVIRQTEGRYVKEEAVASHVGLSRSYLSQCFRDITGIEFKHYLVEKSIAEAKGLLAGTELPFRGISTRLGYQNEGYFSRMFRASTGLSPREYRARLRSQKEHP